MHKRLLLPRRLMCSWQVHLSITYQQVILRLNYVSHFGHGSEQLRPSRVIRNRCGRLCPHPRASAILAVGRAAFGKGRVGRACDFGARDVAAANAGGAAATALETVPVAAVAVTCGAACAQGACATTDTVQFHEKQARVNPYSHLFREVCMNGFAFDTLPLDPLLSLGHEVFDCQRR